MSEIVAIARRLTVLDPRSFLRHCGRDQIDDQRSDKRASRYTHRARRFGIKVDPAAVNSRFYFWPSFSSKRPGGLRCSSASTMQRDDDCVDRAVRGRTVNDSRHVCACAPFIGARCVTFAVFQGPSIICETVDYEIPRSRHRRARARARFSTRLTNVLSEALPFVDDVFR